MQVPLASSLLVVAFATGAAVPEHSGMSHSGWELRCPRRAGTRIGSFGTTRQLTQGFRGTFFLMMERRIPG